MSNGQPRGTSDPLGGIALNGDQPAPPADLHGPATAPEARATVDTSGGARDLLGAERAAAQFLTALQVDLTSEHTRDTPARMARAYAELLATQNVAPTCFAADDGGGLVQVRNIRFGSLCAHHMLPVVGWADLAYLPRRHILGLSKLPRVVQMYARRPQVQESMTGQIADWLAHTLDPEGIGVRIRALHLCMSLRGVRSSEAYMVTSQLRGRLRDDPELRAEWLRAHDHETPSRPW